VIGSFLLYHVYLISYVSPCPQGVGCPSDKVVSTNQTTLENLSPFLLLRYLPSLDTSRDTNSEPLDEDRMSHGQRRTVRDAHQQIRLYDVGWRRNWAQVCGWNQKYGWLYRLWCGGGGWATSRMSIGVLADYLNHSKGDGRIFPRNPRSDEMLARLAAELARLDKDV
jgi:palmitoyltransferase ZDHHC2/15/20